MSPTREATLCSARCRATLGERTFTFGYDGLPRLTSITDPLPTPGIVEFLNFDGADRVRTQRLPGPQGPRDVLFTYDANGNLASLTVPGPTPPAPTPQPHAFQYTKVNLEREYDPPQASPALPVKKTVYDYNLDRQLDLETRPDGLTVDPGYDSAGRLSTLTLPGSQGSLAYGYSPTTGQLISVTGPSADVSLAYIYAGILPTVEALSCQSPACPGTVQASVERTFDTSLRLWKERVSGASEATFTYDNDDLLTQIAIGADTMTLSREAQKGGVANGTTLGSVGDTRTYTSFTEIQSYAATYGATSLYSVTYDQRDKLGRITQKTESVQGGTASTYGYTYDAAGRLATVTKDADPPRVYAYDQNGNPTQAPNLTGTAVYDGQDRLNQYGTTAFTYTSSGELATSGLRLGASVHVTR